MLHPMRETFHVQPMTDEERKNRFNVNIRLPKAEFCRVKNELLPEHRWHDPAHLWEENFGRGHFVLNSPGGGVIVFVAGDE